MAKSQPPIVWLWPEHIAITRDLGTDDASAKLLKSYQFSSGEFIGINTRQYPEVPDGVFP